MMANNKEKANENLIKSEENNMKKEGTKMFRVRISKSNDNGECQYTITVNSFKDGLKLKDILLYSLILEERHGLIPACNCIIKVEVWSTEKKNWISPDNCIELIENEEAESEVA